MILKNFFSFIFALSLPFGAFASSEANYQISIIPENVTIIMKFVIMLLSLFATFYAIKLAALAKGGQMEKTWNMLALTSIFFTIMENLRLLEDIKILRIDGVVEMFELLIALTLVSVFINTRKMLLKQITSK